MTAQPARILRIAPEPAGEPSAALAGPELAIARSVLYASLFDYPLTLAQLRQSLIESRQTATEILQVYEGSAALGAVVEQRDGFFFPRGRADLIDERRRRESRSRAFLRRHHLLLSLVCLIPYVRMVALSGSIAHLNLEGDGDLDLFIVTRGGRVWSVTVAVVVLAKLMRRRSIVCANYVVADSHLALDAQDLFSASQIVHLKPLVGRDVFRAFVAANPFVTRYYPNFHEAGSPALPFRRATVFDAVKRAAERLLAWPWNGLEALCRSAYRGYLRKRSATWESPEQVRLEDHAVKLHTRSHRHSVMERFERTVESLCKAEAAHAGTARPPR
jgi:hypothetical protein